MRKLYYTLPLIILLSLALLFAYMLGHDPRILPSVLLQKKMPTFTAQTLKRKKVDQRIFQNHITILNVWASWCMACHAEHPYLMDVAPNQRIIGINYKDSRKAAQNWLHRFGNPYQKCIYDPNGQIGMQLGVYGTPETYLIDKQGIIRYRHIGVLNKKIWEHEFLPRIKRLQS